MNLEEVEKFKSCYLNDYLILKEFGLCKITKFNFEKEQLYEYIKDTSKFFGKKKIEVGSRYSLKSIEIKKIGEVNQHLINVYHINDNDFKNSYLQTSKILFQIKHLFDKGYSNNLEINNITFER